MHFPPAPPETPRSTVSTIPPTKRPTYPQVWPAYSKAQTTEKDRFLELLFDLCRGIEEPKPKKGQRPLRLADAVFACAFKVYST